MAVQNVHTAYTLRLYPFSLSFPICTLIVYLLPCMLKESIICHKVQEQLSNLKSHSISERWLLTSFIDNVMCLNFYFNFKKKIVNIFLLRIVILVMGIVRVELAFTHEVKPTCLKSSEECTFDLRINYIMSMVYYNWTTDDGMPVFSRNGTFYKKTAPRVGSVNHYCEVNPLLESGMYVDWLIDWFDWLHR